MIRILHAADLHGGVRRYGTGNSRIDDFGRTLRAAVTIANERADVLVLAGDTFDTRRAGPEELSEFTGAIRGREGRPTIMLPGNHDGMTVIGDASTHALLWAQRAGIPGLHVLTESGWHRFDSLLGESFNVYALPYPHRRALDALLADVPVDQRPSAVASAVEDMIEATAKPPAGWDGPRILVGHVSTAGAALSDVSAMRLGWDVAIRAEALAPFDAAMLGHIHRQQRVAPNAWYAGSPDYLDLGDAVRTPDTAPKGFLLWEVDKGGVQVSPVANPEARRMVVHRFRAEGSSVRPEPGQPGMRSGDIAILDVDVSASRPDPTTIAAMARAYRERGVSFVRIREVGQPVAPARAAKEGAQVVWTAEASVADNLARWLRAKGHPEEPALSAGRELIAGQGA